eukprot:Lithocolla_globosa_v1_NODE_3961_length_1543_cov_2.214382.p2 type:complete len:133 gc:universal NODE_3961_length_1543_cov_2.214382:1103-705(-)
MEIRVSEIYRGVVSTMKVCAYSERINKSKFLTVYLDLALNLKQRMASRFPKNVSFRTWGTLSATWTAFSLTSSHGSCGKNLELCSSLFGSIHLYCWDQPMFRSVNFVVAFPETDVKQRLLCSQWRFMQLKKP